MTAQQSIENLKELQRGEIAATETYQQAMSLFEQDSQMVVLQQMHQDHRETANDLRKQIHEHNGKPEQGSGTWGDWAKTIESSATRLGRGPALAALKAGEELGLSSCERAIRDRMLPEDSATYVQTKVLPQAKVHIDTLTRLIDEQE